MRYWAHIALAAIMIATAASPAFAAEHIRIGLLLTPGSAPLYVAVDKGYLKAEGLDPELVPFDAGQPVAVATVSGDIDFGTAGVTSALYTLCAEGALKIVAGSNYDRPGFPAAGLVVSNQADAAGLKTLKDLSGHSSALTQVGSTYHYALAIVAAKDGVDIKSMRMLPLQSLANDASAVTGGQADTAMLTSNQVLPLLAHHDVKLLAWAGEVVPWQVGVMWTATKTANERPKLVDAFLRGLRKGAHEVVDAFRGPDDKRRDGAGAPEIISIIAKHVKLSPEQIEQAIGYMDPDLRLDEKDVSRQIAWYESEGMIKGKFGIDKVIDKRYVKPLPAN